MVGKVVGLKEGGTEGGTESIEIGKELGGYRALYVDGRLNSRFAALLLCRFAALTAGPRCVLDAHRGET